MSSDLSSSSRSKLKSTHDASTCASIFFTCINQEQVASGLSSYDRRKNVCSETSVMANVRTSLNDLPDEILLKILSHFGAEDLCLIIAKVCKRWNILAKDKILWKTLSYSCDLSSDIRRIAEVRCTAFLGFSAN